MANGFPGKKNLKANTKAKLLKGETPDFTDWTALSDCLWIDTVNNSVEYVCHTVVITFYENRKNNNLI